ncbi:peroxiredoxin-like family protein [Sphingopyxis kveilinensis]|uniref:peroxiredoxin-like family protein n=1 Tax=Sphingopyxis kveilinensis TaxID=3114367 RepID=UPI0030CE66D7
MTRDAAGDGDRPKDAAIVGRIDTGHRVGRLDLVAVDGSSVAVPHPQRLTHLQFRRFAGCPVCNVHLRSFARRYADIEAADIREIVFFHSTEAELRKYVADLPFAIVADPTKRYYRAFGVEAGVRALLDPRGWPKILRAVAGGLVDIMRGRPTPPLIPAGGRYGLPADVLIDRDGRVVAIKYGAHVDDQWEVDDLLEIARSARAG